MTAASRRSAWEPPPHARIADLFDGTQIPICAHLHEVDPRSIRVPLEGSVFREIRVPSARSAICDASSAPITGGLAECSSLIQGHQRHPAAPADGARAAGESLPRQNSHVRRADRDLEGWTAAATCPPALPERPRPDVQSWSRRARSDCRCQRAGDIPCQPWKS